MTKKIVLSDEAYAHVKRNQLPNEKFSDTLIRMIELLEKEKNT